MRTASVPLVSLACQVLAACSVMAGFDAPLTLPDLRDGFEEVSFSCATDDDCSALGACVVCTPEEICAEATNADGDSDGHLNIECDGTKKGDDCNDGDATIHPEALERCNGLDDNCDGTVDEGEAFGLAWTVGRSEAWSPSPAAVSGRTGLAWITGTPPCTSVVSAFVDIGGAIRYPTTISECGEDVRLGVRSGENGFAAAWVDRTEGGADILVQLLDSSGDPDVSHPDPTNVSDDYEESDIPALAWSDAGYHFGVAWLSHDTDDRANVRVMFNLLEPGGQPVLEIHRVISAADFRLTGPIESGFGEKIDVVAVESTSFTGFGITWVEESGIWIATIVPTEDGTDIESVQQELLDSNPLTRGAILPGLAWAGDRFVVAYAWVDPDSGKPSPDIELAQVRVEGGALSPEPIAFEYDFPREATYPALVWHEDLSEIGLAWADGREGYGKREVRFTRLKLVDADVTSAEFVLDTGDIVLTDPEAYAGGVSLGVEPDGGFVASWTERGAEGEVSLRVGYLECRQ